MQVISGAELWKNLRTRNDLKSPLSDLVVVTPVFREEAEAYGLPGRDHYSLLLYMGHIVANHGGEICDHRGGAHMRSMQGSDYIRGTPRWKPENGTRLWDGSVLGEHDDYCCLEDLERLGLVKNMGTGLYPIVAFTEAGKKAYNDLIERRQARLLAAKTKKD